MYQIDIHILTIINIVQILTKSHVVKYKNFESSIFKKTKCHKINNNS